MIKLYKLDVMRDILTSVVMAALVLPALKFVKFRARPIFCRKYCYHCTDGNIQCELKRNQDSILNLSKSKRKIMKLLSEVDSIFSFFIWYIPRSYWVMDGCSAIIFETHVKTVFVQVLSLCTMQWGCMNCCFVVKAPANAIMQRKQRQLELKQF